MQRKMTVLAVHGEQQPTEEEGKTSLCDVTIIASDGVSRLELHVDDWQDLPAVKVGDPLTLSITVG